MSIPVGGTPIRDENGDVIAHTRPVRGTHAKCQDRQNCTGPGCRLFTGKTARKNRARA
jgi:hypothetical protein